MPVHVAYCMVNIHAFCRAQASHVRMRLLCIPRDPERVSLAYTEDSEWRNRAEFVKGRAAIQDVGSICFEHRNAEAMNTVSCSLNKCIIMPNVMALFKSHEVYLL